MAAFAAAKTATWHDRRAPRDLWDLCALAEIGAIDAEAAALFRRYGPTNRVPGNHLFEQPPDEADWRSQLAGQTRLTSTASEALAIARRAWARATV
ncbi:nucleotidyl transferase AbiEii/AbiGii toxin family protein [Rhodococcus sp. C26F]